MHSPSWSKHRVNTINEEDIKEIKHKNIFSFWKKNPTYFYNMQTTIFQGSVLGMFSAEETPIIILVIVVIAE